MISSLPFVFEVAVVVLALAVGGALGMVAGDAEAGYQLMDEDLEALRSAFNAHPDSVRAVLLASPT